VTKNLKGLGTATEIAQEIRRKIRCEHVFDRRDVEHICLDLLVHLFPLQKGVRLLGVSLSSLGQLRAGEVRQLTLGF